MTHRALKCALRTFAGAAGKISCGAFEICVVAGGGWLFKGHAAARHALLI
jgi:uridylate kinase